MLLTRDLKVNMGKRVYGPCRAPMSLGLCDMAKQLFQCFKPFDYYQSRYERICTAFKGFFDQIVPPPIYLVKNVFVIFINIYLY